MSSRFSFRSLSMDITARITALVSALDLEPKSTHDRARLEWAHERKTFELERTAWEMERQSWTREREAWKTLADTTRTMLDQAHLDRAPSAVGAKDGRQVCVFWPVDERDANGSFSPSQMDPIDHVGRLRELARSYGQLSAIKAYAGASGSHHDMLRALGVDLRTCQSEASIGSIHSHVFLDAMHFALASALAPSQITLVFVTDDMAYLPLLAKLRMIGCTVVLAARHVDASNRLLRAVASEVLELDSSLGAAGDTPNPILATGDDETTPPAITAESPALPVEVKAGLVPLIWADDVENDIGMPGSFGDKPASSTAGPSSGRVLPNPSPNDITLGLHPADPISIPLPRPTADELEPSLADRVEPRDFDRRSVDGPVAHSTSSSAGRSRTQTVDDHSGWASGMASSVTSVHGDDQPPGKENKPVDTLLTATSSKPTSVFGANNGQSNGGSSSSGGWDLDPVASPSSTHESYEGEGWGVPPPPSHAEAALISTLNSQRRSNGWSPSAPASVASSSKTRAPPVPISKFSTSTLASVVRAPPFFPPPAPPPAPEPMQFYPETHNRQPTYINASPSLPSGLPNRPSRQSSTGSSRTTSGSYKEALNFTPLLREIASFLPEERPQRSSVNDNLVRRRPKFYQEEKLGSWKTYAENAQKVGLVEMGSNEGGVGGGQWIRLTTWGQMKVSRG